MANNSKKQSFLGGAAILAGAVAVVKIIGAIYRIPINNILGSEGKTYFNIAYNIYNVLLTISTAGLPLAISKLTSQAHALGRENERRQIFRSSIWLFFGLGLAGALLMFFRARQLAELMHQPLAESAIKTLAPAVFCVCLLACMRGYTQGQGNMKPTAISQILEALCKLGVGLPVSWYLLRTLHAGVQYGAAGAILGVTVGTVLSMLFMIFYMIRHRDTSHSEDVPPSSGTLMRQILAIGIPITLSNSAMSIITLVDTQIVLSRLDSIKDLLPVAPNVLYGYYGYSNDLINLPPSFVFPVTMSLFPFAAAALARNDTAKANRIFSSAFRLIALLAIPAGIGLSVLAGPILLLLYPAQPEAALAAAPLLRVLGFACIFICIMNLTNAILQSYGQEKLPIYTMIAGGLTKIVMNYYLVGNPEINIAGAPISTLCCYVVIVSLNLFFVWKYSPQKLSYGQLFTKPIIASLLMGASAWAAYGILSRALTGSYMTLASQFSTGIAQGEFWVHYKNNAVSTLGAIAIAVAIYGILVLALRILRAEDLESVPHGKKLAKILRLK